MLLTQMLPRPSSAPSYCISHSTVISVRSWEPKDHLNIFIYDPIAPDPEGIIKQGKANSAARAIQVYEGEPIKKRALLNLLAAGLRRNREAR